MPTDNLPHFVGSIRATSLLPPSGQPKGAIVPHGAFELLSGLGLALYSAINAGALDEWQMPLRSLI